MKQDVFEWDDATQKIVEKAVESRELDNATENLKNQADDSLDKNFNQFNFEEVLRERDTVIKSVQQVLGPKLDSFEKWHSKIVGRNGGLEESEMESDFLENKRDNAVDWSDYEQLWENYERLRSIHSLTTIWAFVAHANSSDVGKAVDIRQMQADQNKAMEMVNKHYDKFIDAADRIGRQVKDGQREALKEAMEEVMDKPEERLEELERKVERKDDRIEELEEKLEDKESRLIDPSSVEALSDQQQEIYQYLQNNPDASEEEISEECDVAPNQVPLQLQRIEKRGWPLPNR